MSDGDGGLEMLTGEDESRPRRPGSRRRADPPPRRSGALKGVIALLVIVAIGVAGYVGITTAMDRLGGAEDYTGGGSGTVEVSIPAGANGVQIARILAEADVVKSSEAFYQVSLSDPRAQQIQPGTYRLRGKMSAEAALTALVDPSSRVQSKFTVPEGSRVDDVVAIIAKNTELSEDELRAALDDPEAIGLPAQAGGNPEGFLFPETYFVEPGQSAVDVIKAMVDQTMSVLNELEVGPRARALDMTGLEVLTVASILEWEVNNDDDFAKASRVIQNRLAAGQALQMDSTVHFISGRKGDAYTTDEERAADSPYNTYKYPGLPPGPIGSPGRAAIQAALNPADGDWLYFVADPKTGETTFTSSYAEHQQACRATGIEC